MPLRPCLVLLPLAAAVAPKAALADVLVAVRPGLMCSSPDALSRLTLPGGVGRTAAPGATPEDFEAARQGGCIDIPPGAQVAVQAARRQTSVVLFDAGDGRGARTFVVPNIDFSPVAPSPATASAPSSGTASGTTPAAAGRNCLSYNVPVTLRGTVTPGPAYGNRLDQIIGTNRRQQITLDQPICTRASPETAEAAEQNVRALQPAWMGQGTYDFVTGRHVTLNGKLSHRDNGPRMAKVLIEVGHAAMDN